MNERAKKLERKILLHIRGDTMIVKSYVQTEFEESIPGYVIRVTGIDTEGNHLEHDIELFIRTDESVVKLHAVEALTAMLRMVDDVRMVEHREVEFSPHWSVPTDAIGMKGESRRNGNNSTHINEVNRGNGDLSGELSGTILRDVVADREREAGD